MTPLSKTRVNLGFGIGLRPEHYEAILTEKPHIDWLEILTENYLVPGGKPLHYLDQFRDLYPIVMHGVSMSIGSCDPLDWDYLKEIKHLASRIHPKWISDHLCWTGLHRKNMHDLLPLPYTEEAIHHIVDRIKQVQDFLGQRILIENVSSYVTYRHSVLTEWDFLKEICARADCLILLDVNNVYVSSVNHKFNPLTYITSMPSERVYQIHLAGHSNMGSHIIDTHDHDIIDPVWKLYEATLQHLGQVSTMIERDDNIPELSCLMTELDYARNVSKKANIEAVA